MINNESQVVESEHAYTQMNGSGTRAKNALSYIQMHLLVLLAPGLIEHHCNNALYRVNSKTRYLYCTWSADFPFQACTLGWSRSCQKYLAQIWAKSDKFNNPLEFVVTVVKILKISPIFLAIYWGTILSKIASRYDSNQKWFKCIYSWMWFCSFS